MDKEGELANSINTCAESKNQTKECILLLENKTPALFVIGGKLDSMMMVDDVFVSQPGGE